MKIFIKKSIVFSILIIIFIETVSAFLVFTNLYLIDYPGNSIYNAIKKSKEKNSSKILLLGDSVGNQLFPNTNNSIELNSLACNQAIGIVGHFLLLNNYLSTGNRIDKLYMLFTPLSFQNNLNDLHTYHYFLKPFYNSEYMPFLSATVTEQVKKIPYSQFVQVPHILVTSWGPDFMTPDIKDYTFLSPISAEYLMKIKELSIEYNFQLIILPTPTNIDKKKLIKTMNRNEYAKCNLEQEFNNYFDKIIYLDSIKFMDGTHLIDPEEYIELYVSEFIE